MSMEEERRVKEELQVGIMAIIERTCKAMDTCPPQFVKITPKSGDIAPHLNNNNSNIR